MKWGLSDLSHQILTEKLFTPLKNRNIPTWIFGSRVRSDFKEFSDLDVLIDPLAPLPVGFLSQIREALEESRLPIRVDIVELADLAESYKENILKERVPVD